MSDLSICLPFEPPEIGGGGFRVLRMWEAWLTKQGIRWSRRWADGHNALFVNGWHASPWKVRLWKYAYRGTVVHRVDGWPPLYGREDGIETRLVKINRLADVTIHQSQWARRIPTMSGYLRDGPVIHNPVDTEIFTPDGERHLMRHPEPMVAIMGWSTNPKKGMEHVWNLAGAHPDVRFVLIGRFDRPLRTLRMANIHEIGYVREPKEIAAVLRSCDCLVTFAENEACPNHVLEAMACGLPVLYLRSGATGEIVGEAGRPITSETFAAHLEYVLFDRYRKMARATALGFSPEITFPLYLDAIRKARS